MRNILAIFILASVWSTVHAQGEANPEAAWLKYAEASKSFNAAQIAGIMHPEALVEFREAFDEAFQGDNSARARAELLPVFTVASYEEFSALSDAEAFRRLIETVTASTPDIIDLMSTAEYDVAGQVQDGDDVLITYFLTLEVEGQVIRREAVQRLRQHEGSWLLMLPPDSEATIAAIRAAY